MNKDQALLLLSDYYDSRYKADIAIHDKIRKKLDTTNDWLISNSQDFLDLIDLHLFVNVEIGLENQALGEVTLSFVHDIISTPPLLSDVQIEWFDKWIVDLENDRKVDIRHDGIKHVKVKKILKLECISGSVILVQFITDFGQNKKYLVKRGSNWKIFYIHDGLGRLSSYSDFSSHIPIII